MIQSKFHQIENLTQAEADAFAARLEAITENEPDTLDQFIGLLDQMRAVMVEARDLNESRKTA